jgi:hypothetical protein
MFGFRGVNATAGSDFEILVKNFDILNEIHCLLEAAGFDHMVSMPTRDPIPRYPALSILTIFESIFSANTKLLYMRNGFSQ